MMLLRDLVPFVQFIKREKLPGRSVTFSNTLVTFSHPYAKTSAFAT